MGLRSWLGDRLPVSGQQFRELTNEPVPYHLKRWWFALGGTPAYLFIVQIFTGILLAFYYEASPTTAYESVEYITREVSFGWYIRSVHKWAATLMIVAVILHQIRVFFTGAYRKPRELNWLIGMCLLMCTLVVGFTGYSLVYEQLSFWGATVAANLAGAVPLIFTGLAVAIPFRAGLFNIGAEGQLTFGAIAGGGLALLFYESEGVWLLPAMIVAGAFGGMLWASVPAYLRTRFNTNEILVSLMLTYVATLMLSYLVHGPFKDPDGYDIEILEAR